MSKITKPEKVGFSKEKLDHKEDLVGIVHTQLLPDGTYP